MLRRRAAACIQRLLFLNRTRLRTRVRTANGGNETIDQKRGKSSYAKSCRSLSIPFYKMNITEELPKRTRTRYSFGQIALFSACGKSDDLATGICLTFAVVSRNYRGSMSPTCAFTYRTFYSHISRETCIILISSFQCLTLKYLK